MLKLISAVYPLDQSIDHFCDIGADFSVFDTNAQPIYTDNDSLDLERTIITLHVK